MSGTAGAWLRAARPKQWIKNLLVFAAPGAAGVLDQGDDLARTCGAFVCFCAVASGTYLLNDARDVESDRLHPTKRERPIAAGEVPVRAAVPVGIVVLLLGVLAGAAIDPNLGVALAAYIAITASYSWGLRDIAVVDLLAIASGFVLRAIAGATAVDVPISDWFFIVTSAGALFMAVGKRTGEAGELTVELAAAIRPTLAAYSPAYLSYLRSVTSGVLLVAYCLWAFETADVADATGIWYELSIVPFAAAIFRYALLVDQGQGSAPEQVVLTDRVLQAIGCAWLVVYGVAVYGS